MLGINQTFNSYYLEMGPDYEKLEEICSIYQKSAYEKGLKIKEQEEYIKKLEEENRNLKERIKELEKEIEELNKMMLFETELEK